MASSIECLTNEKLLAMRGTLPSHVRRMLSHFLNWSYLSDEDSGDLRHIIVIDILQDHICFCFTSLFTIKATKEVTRFVNFILLKSPCWSITDTIAYLTSKVKSNFNSTMSEENVKCYVNFFKNEFLKVYKLIQFVFCQTRHKITRELCLEVCTPHYLPRLYRAKPAEIYEYEKKIEIINDEEIRKCELRENLKRAFDGEKRMIIEGMKKENKIITTNDVSYE
ncbi:hypothetical protein HELRODRAFT_172281 [Helobdella robusta]|uniref:Uncharacterized protein n=1 Tax=Helobdella robusta TaxID=6412 RepID=T1F564_HELRO|nr:hypothetical protein HELRODRAFT_172281 [Helobdella robusta]ESO04615.1 hypothetical protein HELRODRAFT_172281 [Helobdella robusta]